MFGKEAPRLLRKLWPNAQQLAEELYAMFQDDIPLSQNAPVTFSANGKLPPLRLQQYGDGPLLSLDGPGGTPLGSLWPYDNPLPGGSTLIWKKADDKPGAPEPAPPPGTKSTVLAGTVPGIVFSGSDGDYLVDIFKNGLAHASERVAVRQVQFAGGTTIPPGSGCMVSQAGDGLFYMQVGVWL